MARPAAQPNSATSQTPAAQPTMPNPQNDMEIPAFLRNRMGR